MMEKFGSCYFVTTDEFRKKCNDTMMTKYGAYNTVHVPSIYKKIKIALFSVKKYKDTNVYYQGSYELLFLHLIEKFGLINFVNNPLHIEYSINNKTYHYYPDFVLFNKYYFEIKSSWTYNNNGKNLILQEKNNLKWNTARNIYGSDNFIILNGKEAINEFFENKLKNLISGLN